MAYINEDRLPVAIPPLINEINYFQDVDKVRGEVDWIVNGRIDERVLLKALEIATGNDQVKMDFLISHAYKDIVQDMGVIAAEQILFKGDETGHH